jgi:serine/threonine protein phosphatase PrpC
LADPAPPVAVRSFGLTDPGRVRPANEDHFLIAELARTLWVRQTSLPQPPTHHGRNRGHVFLVADGVGGHQAGEVASALSVASIEAFVLHVLHAGDSRCYLFRGGRLRQLTTDHTVAVERARRGG